MIFKKESLRLFTFAEKKEVNIFKGRINFNRKSALSKGETSFI